MPLSIDELQQRGQHIRDAIDGPAGDVASLKTETGDTAQTFASLGQESSAAILSESASPKLDEIARLLQQAQSLFDDFIADCAQAKGGGG